MPTRKTVAPKALVPVPVTTAAIPPAPAVAAKAARRLPAKVAPKAAPASASASASAPAPAPAVLPNASAKPAAKPAPKAAAKPAAAPADKAPLAAKPVKVEKTEKGEKLEKPDRAAKPPKTSKTPKVRQKPVRDSFTMPEADFALIATLKARALSAHRVAKKSELLRAGLHALAALATPALVTALSALEPVKIGRPKKGG